MPWNNDGSRKFDYGGQTFIYSSKNIYQFISDKSNDIVIYMSFFIKKNWKHLNIYELYFSSNFMFWNYCSFFHFNIIDFFFLCTWIIQQFISCVFFFLTYKIFNNILWEQHLILKGYEIRLLTTLIKRLSKKTTLIKMKG